MKHLKPLNLNEDKKSEGPYRKGESRFDKKEIALDYEALTSQWGNDLMGHLEEFKATPAYKMFYAEYLKHVGKNDVASANKFAITQAYNKDEKKWDKKLEKGYPDED